MYLNIALSLLASTQLIAGLPQNSIKSFQQGINLEKNITRANIRTPGGKVTKIRYGPFAIPAMGMLDNKDIRNIERPCSDCYITAFQADLEDEAGNSVNTDKGAWLHRKFENQTYLKSPHSRNFIQTLLCIWPAPEKKTWFARSSPRKGSLLAEMNEHRKYADILNSAS
jgi:hypothetical protein